MKPNHTHSLLEPPAWLEAVLILVLSERDRETIPGDLGEAYRDTKLPQLGRRRASLWYARQVLSLVPRCLAMTIKRSPVLTLICLFTAICGCWLGTMGLILGHPAFSESELIAGVIVGQALLTLIALSLPGLRSLTAAAMPGCFLMLFLAGKVLAGLVRGADIEGYVLLIAVALTIQAILTLATFRRTSQAIRR